MKKAILILGGLAVLALMAMPVWAGMSPIADSELAGISGKANNQYLFSGTSNTSQVLTSDNSANIQVGWYQWNDNHSADVSDHKGANDVSGTSTTTQENVVADTNIIQWGAAATLNWVTTTETSSGTIAQMPYAVFANGGF
jgi:hypothetical protein